MSLQNPSCPAVSSSLHAQPCISRQNTSTKISHVPDLVIPCAASLCYSQSMRLFDSSVLGLAHVPMETRLSQDTVDHPAPIVRSPHCDPTDPNQVCERWLVSPDCELPPNSNTPIRPASRKILESSILWRLRVGFCPSLDAIHPSSDN